MRWLVSSGALFAFVPILGVGSADVGAHEAQAAPQSGEFDGENEADPTDLSTFAACFSGANSAPACVSRV